MSLNSKKINASLATTLGLASTLTLAGLTSAVSATGVSGNVQLNTEVSTSIAMKIASPNDTNPDCMEQSGVTYGVANRYATSNGAEGSKQVDTFDGTPGGADELNSNTSCATLTMTPNTFDSTYSDVTVYTNSGNGYAVSLRSADNTSPNLVKTNSDGTLDSTQYIAAGALTESGNTVPGGQNKWAYKTDNGITTSWTAATTTDATIKSYAQETSGGDTTRVTYGISAGNNPTGKYATTLTYTATMFDDANPYISKLSVPAVSNLTISADSLSIPFGKTATVTVTPASGYYLSGVTCPEGFTCTGYTTDKSDSASAAAQTITATNNNTNTTGTLAFAVTKLIDGYMQDFSAAEHAGDAAGTTYALVDSRDKQEYTAAKLADGNIWMTQDLKLGGDSALTLTSADSDVSSNYTLPAENTGTWCTDQTAACYNQSLMRKTGAPNGYLYNWYTATAGTGVYDTGADVNATASICPKGWKLPTGGASGQFAALDVAYGGSGDNRDDATQKDKFMAAPLNFNYTGYVNGGSVGNPSGSAYYWSRTASSEMYYAYYFDFYSNNYFYPQNYYYERYVGYAVRCVATS